MGETLTIIEAPPSGFAKSDPAIQTFLDWFAGKSPPLSSPRPPLPSSTATSVSNLRTRLKPPPGGVPKPYERIQLIGHGAPGLLSLGWTWTRTYSNSATGVVYLLDSNPYSYDILSGYVDPADHIFKKLLNPITEVCLVGCYVATDKPSLTVANGDTLMSDLAQMWGCKVSAATDLVTTATLDDSGLYAGEAVIWSWNPTPTRTVRPATNAAMPPTTEPIGERVVFNQLLSAPVLGLRDRQFRVSVDPRVGQALQGAFSMRLTSVPPFHDVPPLLAFPELIFDVTWRGSSHIANLIGSHRYLQVLNGQGEVLVTLAASPDQVDALGNILRSWLESILDSSRSTDRAV